MGHMGQTDSSGQPLRRVDADELMGIIAHGLRKEAQARGVIWNGWTSVEAFARFAGMLVRTNANPGRQEDVMKDAWDAMLRGFVEDSAEDVFGRVEP